MSKASNLRLEYWQTVMQRQFGSATVFIDETQVQIIISKSAR